MRPLTDDETKSVLGKIDKFIGSSVKLLVDREDGVYCFRIQKDRVFYISERVLKVACNVPREQLLMMGVCFGKFTKTGKSDLSIKFGPWHVNNYASSILVSVVVSDTGGAAVR